MSSNLPKKQQITSLTKYRDEVESYQVVSRTYTPYKLTLKDYEQFFNTEYVCRYNKVKADYELGQTVISDVGVEYTDYTPMNFEEVINDMNRAGAKERGKKEVSDQDLIRIIKDRRIVPEFDPMLSYFEGLDYFDENELGHIDNLANYVTVEGGEEKQTSWQENFKKSLVRTVKCALNPLYFNKHCLVLYSSGQSKGKTSFLRTLCPPELGDYYYEEMIGTDKDSQIMLGKSFIVLLDEISVLSKMDINALKAVFSKREVTVRLPYEKKPEKFPRRCSFFATTNRNDFLVDGENVRWLVFNVEDIDMSYGNIFTGEYNIDINKVWAEAYYLYRNGYNPELSAVELSLNEDSNGMYTTTSVERDIIDELFIPASSDDKDKKGYYRGQPTQLYEKAIELLTMVGRDSAVKALEKNSRMFYVELGRLKGWKKMSVKLEDGRVVAGYHYLVRKEIDDSELF